MCTVLLQPLDKRDTCDSEVKKCWGRESISFVVVLFLENSFQNQLYKGHGCFS